MQLRFQCILQDHGKIDPLSFRHSVQPRRNGQSLFHRPVVKKLPIFDGVAADQRHQLVFGADDTPYIGYTYLAIMLLLILWFLFSSLLLLLCIIARIHTYANSFLRIYTYFFQKEKGRSRRPSLARIPSVWDSAAALTLCTAPPCKGAVAAPPWPIPATGGSVPSTSVYCP